MLRTCIRFTLFALLGSLGVVFPASAADSPLIPEHVAQQHGLERPWFVQADINRARSRLLDMELYDGVLYLVSEAAVVEAIDAETGAVLWTKQLGNPAHPTMPLAVGGDVLAVLNGSRIYVANRYNGAILFEHDVDGAPGGGPAVNNKHVYVPMTTGMVVGYRLDLLSDMKQEAAVPTDALSPEEAQQVEKQRREKIYMKQGPVRSMYYRSKGRALVQPLMMRESKEEEYVTWPTDQGYLYIARVDRHDDHIFDLRARIRANAPITMQPGFLPPSPKIIPDVGVLFFGSNDGFVTAIREDGVVLWQFPTGEPIVQSPVSIGDRVYFSTQFGGMYCVDAKPGESDRPVLHWHAPGALQFLAAGKKNVYAADRAGNTLIIDAETGAQVDSLDTQKLTVRYSNSQTDRLYLATPDGLVQCLHEAGLKEPLRYDLMRKEAQESAKPAADKKTSGKAGEEAAPAKKAPPKEPAKDSKKAKAEKAAEPAAETEAAPEEKTTPDKPEPEAGEKSADLFGPK